MGTVQTRLARVLPLWHVHTRAWPQFRISTKACAIRKDKPRMLSLIAHVLLVIATSTMTLRDPKRGMCVEISENRVFLNRD